MTALRPDAVRMNFSHGSYDYHQSVIDNTRAAVARESLVYPAKTELTL